MARYFRPAVEIAGLAPLRFHDLRHTAAALAIHAGAHPKAIGDRLGHSSINQRRYPIIHANLVFCTPSVRDDSRSFATSRGISAESRRGQEDDRWRRVGLREDSERYFSR